jgi:hypothetical protein
MNFGTKGCMYNCGDSCTGECMKSMSREQNARILTDLLEYLKEQHSNLPTHVFEVLGEVIDDLKQYKVMNEFYQLKSECELPATLLTYTYKDFEGVLHPFASIHIDFRDSDEINIQKMEKVKSKYGEFFMFFNNSKEGKEFWKKQSITITTKQ